MKLARTVGPISLGLISQGTIDSASLQMLNLSSDNCNGWFQCNYIRLARRWLCKLILPIIVFCSFVLFGINEAKADCSNIPLPDCPNEPFQYGGRKTIAYPEGSECLVTYSYCYRYCNMIYEVYIDTIIIKPDCLLIIDTSNPDIHIDLLRVCLLSAVSMGIIDFIPPCDESWATIVHTGHPTCMSDFYPAVVFVDPNGGKPLDPQPQIPNIDTNGPYIIEYKSVPCHSESLPNVCWEVWYYCWDTLADHPYRVLNIGYEWGPPNAAGDCQAYQSVPDKYPEALQPNLCGLITSGNFVVPCNFICK